jgi:hypothetical protein
MSTWSGTTEISLNDQEYIRNPAENYFREIELIPDPALTGTAQSVLMGCGRKRARKEISGYLPKTDYDNLQADYYDYVAGACTFGDNTTGTYYMEKLAGARRRGEGDRIYYKATLIEA